MSEATDPHADVFVDQQMVAGLEQPIVDALTALGFSARSRVIPQRRLIEPVTWIILVALPLQAFLSGIGTKVAEDSYHGLRAAIRKVLGRSEARSPGAVVLQDPASGIRIILDPDLPDEGYQQLLALDLAQFQLGPIHYDRAQRRWRSDLDEARPHRS